MLMSICPIVRDILPFGFVPGEVDEWFRGLIHELKEDRIKTPPKQEDLFQMLLNSVDKYGKYAQGVSYRSFCKISISTYQTI